MSYLLLFPVGLLAVWLTFKKRRMSQYIRDCRDRSYLQVFETATLASERGQSADDLCRSNPLIARDREDFINICYSSGVRPELAAQAWIDRALSPMFRNGAC